MPAATLVRLHTSSQQKPGNSMTPLVLALDQGTTSSRAIVFDSQLAVRGRGQFEFTQDLADMLDMAVDRPTILETTALGAAWLAGHYAGIWPDQSGFADLWRLDRRFEPHLSVLERQRRFATWKKAVRATISMTGSN
jgi:glycerol kinase